MMNSFWQDTKAFTPFFDTPIVVERQQANVRLAGNYSASVIDNGFALPFAEADIDSSIRTYAIEIMAGDWLENKPPQVGDKIVVDCSTPCTPNLPSLTLAVSHIDSVIGTTWSITAKEVKL